MAKTLKFYPPRQSKHPASPASLPQDSFWDIEVLFAENEAN